MKQLGAGDEDCEALRPRDRDVQPVAAEEEFDVARISAPLEVAIEKKATGAPWPYYFGVLARFPQGTKQA